MKLTEQEREIVTYLLEVWVKIRWGLAICITALIVGVLLCALMVMLNSK